MNKRGISDLIAVVLLLVVTISATGIVWQIVIPIAKQSTEIKERCQSVFLEVSKSFYNDSLKEASILVSRGVPVIGTKTAELTGIQIKITSDTGGSKTVMINGTDTPLPKVNEDKIYKINLSSLTGSSFKASVAPVVKVNNKNELCPMSAERSLVVSFGIMPTSDWPMFGRYLNHTAYTSEAGPKTNNLLWRYTVDPELIIIDPPPGYSPPGGSPVVLKDIIYIASFAGGYYYALNATNSSLIKTYEAEMSGSESFLFVTSSVLYTVDWSSVCAYNITTTSLIWDYDTGGGIYSSPVVANDILYIGSTDNHMYALNATNGNPIWDYACGDDINYSTASVVNGIVYFGSTDGYVYALYAANGSQKWNYNVEEGIIFASSPTVVNDIVYIASTSSDLAVVPVKGATVYALNATNGNLIWSFDYGQYTYSSPAVANDIVYIGSKENGDYSIYAINATNGSKIWDYQTGGAIYNSPAVAQDIVYIGSDDSYVYALNATNGNLIWNYDADRSFFCSAAIIANGVLYMGSGDGRYLYAFKG